jgi:uncharacterized delta-60 repeat protein
VNLARTRSFVGLAGLCAAGACVALVRCGDDSSACDACADVTATPLTIALTPAEIWIHPSDAKPIAVALARNAGGAGDVSVTIETDAGFTADTLTIADGQTAGTLVVHVPPSFTQGETTLTVDAQTPTTLAQATLVVHVAGASGTLDTSFGASGVTALDPGSGQELARAMIALQSGVLVGVTHVETASSMKVLRLTSGGAIDSSFATTTTPGDLASIAMLPDARVFAVGSVQNGKFDFAAVRIAAAGGLDPTYAVGSPISLGDDLAFAAAIQPGGRLVAAGSAADASAIALASWTQAPLPPPDAGPDAGDSGADASDADESDADDASDAVATDATVSDADASPNTAHLDPTFGEGGIVVAPSDPQTGARSLLVGSDGSLYAIGFASSDLDTIALHFGASGALDGAFGDGGVARVNGASGAVAAFLEPSGSIAVATHTSLFRLSSVGAPGSATALPNGANATSIARDPASGAIYVGGSSGTQCLVARYTSALALDATFANAGVLAWTSSDACVVAALGVDDDGNLLALATVTTSGATHAAVARYWP